MGRVDGPVGRGGGEDAGASGGQWGFGAGAGDMYKSDRVYYRSSRYSLDASQDFEGGPGRIVWVFERQKE